MKKMVLKAIQDQATRIDLSVDFDDKDMETLIQQCPKLTKMFLSSSSFLKYLSRFQNLTDLTLSPWSFTKEECEELGILTNLRHLELQGVVLSEDFFKNLEKLNNLESLSFIDCENVYDESLENIVKLKNIRSFYLDRPNITLKGLKIISSLKQLTSLTLIFSDVTNQALEYFKSLKNLRELTLKGCKINLQGIKCIAFHKELTKLDLDQLGFELTNTCLKQISTLIRLRELSLTCLSNYNDEGLAHLAKLSNLETLKLDISVFVTEGIKYLGSFSNLRRLHLNAPGHYEKNAFSFISRLKELQELSLFLIEDSVSEDIASLKKLQFLALNSNPITDKALQNLAPLTELSNLNLSSCKNITDQGLSYLISLQSLTELNLSHCNLITDKGIQYLSHLKNLTNLNLYKCELVSDEGLNYLQNLTKLRSLELRFCYKVTDAGCEALMDNNPLLRIEKLYLRKKNRA